MSIDQGTTSTRVCLLDEQGQLVFQEQKPFQQIFPKPGWVEHNPEEIWGTVQSCIKALFASNKITFNQIEGIGITNQRETVVVWDQQTGKPVYNAIVWQCRRTSARCESIKKNKDHLWISKKTGLVLDPYFSATKIEWILKNIPDLKKKAQRGLLKCGTIESYIIWKLSGGGNHITDVSNASRTMLMNLQTTNWDDELLKFFGIPKSMLPAITDSSGQLAQTRGLDFLPDGIVISGIAGDQQAALFGQLGFKTGDSKCTFGTGSFILLNTGTQVIRSKSRLLSTVAWRLPKQKTVYALEGGAFICGAAVQWLRDGLGLIHASSEVEALAATVEDSAGVDFVPALTGLGAPHWRSEARGIITGLTRGSTKAHVARATLEAMALQNAEILFAMERDLNKKIKSLRVDGGATVNNLLMQIQADYLGRNVIRPKNVESTVMGAGYLAGLGVGFWSLESLQNIWKIDQEFKPQIATKIRLERFKRWNTSLEKA